MAIGDMKCTFFDRNNNEQQIEVPAQYLRQAKRAGLSNREAYMMYAKEQGFDVEIPEEVTKKMEQKTTAGTKKRTRKPNEIKRHIIDVLARAINGDGYETEVTNVERQFRFEIDGATYEVTLVQKRKAK